MLFRGKFPCRGVLDIQDNVGVVDKHYVADPAIDLAEDMEQEP